MKTRINPETGELVWEAETKAEKAQAKKANKAAKAAPLEALAEAFGETEGEKEETQAANLQNFCRLLCEAITVSLPEETNTALWEAFKEYQSALNKKPVPEEDLRDIFDALLTGLT